MCFLKRFSFQPFFRSIFVIFMWLPWLYRCIMVFVFSLSTGVDRFKKIFQSPLWVVSHEMDETDIASRWITIAVNFPFTCFTSNYFIFFFGILLPVLCVTRELHYYFRGFYSCYVFDQLKLSLHILFVFSSFSRPLEHFNFTFYEAQRKRNSSNTMTSNVTLWLKIIANNKRVHWSFD